MNYNDIVSKLQAEGVKLVEYNDGSGCADLDRDFIVARKGWVGGMYGYYESFDSFAKAKWGIKSLPEQPADALINKPEHYTLPRAASDCFSVMQQIGMLNNHCLATAFKYLWRAQLKNQYISDLKKARWFIDKAIDEHEAKERSRSTDK